MRRRPSSRSGFTVMEVALALATLAIIISGAAATLTVARVAAVESQTLTAVHDSALEYLDRVAFHEDFDTVISTWDGFGFDVVAAGAPLTPSSTGTQVGLIEVSNPGGQRGV